MRKFKTYFLFRNYGTHDEPCWIYDGKKIGAVSEIQAKFKFGLYGDHRYSCFTYEEIKSEGLSL